MEIKNLFINKIYGYISVNYFFNHLNDILTCVHQRWFVVMNGTLKTYVYSSFKIRHAFINVQFRKTSFSSFYTFLLIGGGGMFSFVFTISDCHLNPLD